MPKPKNFALFVLLSCYGLIASGYSIAIPLGEAPDEVSHFAYVQSLAKDHRLPTHDSAASGQAHQGPLYYLLGAAFTFWIPQQDFQFIANPDWTLDNPETPNLLLHTRQEAFPYHGGALAWHLVRLLSVVLGAFTVALTYFLAQEVFPRNEVAVVAAGFIAFLPEFGFLSGMVNNDNLVIVLTVASLLFFLRSWNVRSFRTGIILGLLLGLGLLAKFSALVLWATIALAVVLGLKGGQLSERIKNLTVVFAVAGLVVAPWIIYNAVAFGDPFTWSRLISSTPRIEPMTVQDWEIYARRMFESFWGKYGGAAHLGFPPFAYISLTGLVVLAGCGIALLANDWRSRRSTQVNRNALITLFVFELLLLLAHLRLNMSLLGADQARQVFSGLPFFSILLAAGLHRLTATNSTRLNYVFVGGMSLISVAGLIFVASLFTPPIETRAIPPSSTTSADFGKKIRLIGYRVTPVRVAAGNLVDIEVQWQALDGLKENYWALFQLVDKEGNVQVNKDSVPSAGRVTTDWWLKGQTFSSHHILRIPEDLASGMYKLQIGIHPFGRWEWLSVQGQDTFTLDRIQVQ